jgi:glutathione S-transferase
MTQLGITCDIINVPSSKADRKELIEISGQRGVPTLVTDDGRVIPDDDDAIIAYFVNEYRKG